MYTSEAPKSINGFIETITTELFFRGPFKSGKIFLALTSAEKCVVFCRLWERLFTPTHPFANVFFFAAMTLASNLEIFHGDRDGSRKEPRFSRRAR